MGGGSPKGSEATSVPSYLKPYMQELAGFAADFAYGFEPPAYEDVYDPNKVSAVAESRLEGFTPMQEEAQWAAQDMYERGDQYTPAALGIQGVGLEGLGGMQDLDSGFVAQDYDFSFTDNDALSPTGRFGNPYQQNVTDIALDAYRESAAQKGIQDASQAISRGSRGGSREMLGQILAGNTEAQGLADIQARGSEAGYMSALERMEAERTAYIEANKMGQVGRTTAADLDLRAQEGTAQNRINQAQGFYQFADQTQGFGKTAQEMESQRIANMDAAGAQQQGFGQAALDLTYGDVSAEQDRPMQMMNWLMGIFGGTPQAISAPQNAMGQGVGGAAQTLFNQFSG